MKILVIDTCFERRQKLVGFLASSGWNADELSAGRALQRLRRERYDAIIIAADPLADALEICRLHRISGGMTPIIFVGGTDNIDDKESAFDAGADDYVSRASDYKELVARVKNQLGRSSSVSNMKLTAGAVELDACLRIVSYKDRSKHLSEMESLILAFLFVAPRQTFTSQQLFEKLWTERDSSSEATVRVHINSLRKKLTEIGAGNLLRTVRGKGYMVFPSQDTNFQPYL